MMVLKDTKDIKEHQELMLVKVHKGIRDIRVMKVPKDIKGKTELMLVKVLRDIKDIKDIKGKTELMLVKVLKVMMEHKVLKDIRVIKVDYLPSQFLLVVLSYGLVQQMLFQVVGYYVMVVIIRQT